LTSALDGVGWSKLRAGRLTPGERHVSHCMGGWAGPRACLDNCGKSLCHRYLIPGPSNL